MQHKHQQYTYYSNQNAQNFLAKALDAVASVFTKNFSSEQTAALILIGGYGRGEGGIVYKNDNYYPHNNLDLLYIYNAKIDDAVLQKVDKALQDLAAELDIGIDIFAISKKKLLKLDGLVIGYDMRFGHKTLLGDSSFLKEHEKFSLSNIDSADMRQLLVNRGTLLLINRVLLKKESLSESEKKLIIKHTIKAIIGYGDALLYFHDAYHWSYAQKQSNMMSVAEISPEVKNLYSQALLFRFKPDYDAYMKKDLHAYNDALIQIFSSIHLACEKMNLSTENLSWENYFNTALSQKSYSRQGFFQKGKSCLFGLHDFSVLKELKSFDTINSYMQFGAKGILSLLFPYIAYKQYPKQYLGLLNASFATKESSEENYLKGFLTLWSQHGDTNFKNVLNTHNIRLESL